MKELIYRLTAYTDPAGKRNEQPPLYGNEDNFFVNADLSIGEQGKFVTDEPMNLSDCGCLMVIADGMGGMNAGEVASEIAIKTVKRFFATEKINSGITATARSREKYMEEVVVAADTAIKTAARNNPEYEGMGSTIIMVWLCRGEASVTWCGDSRAYLFREPIGIVQISKDHSYVQSLVDDKKITEAEAFDHPYGNIITRSLGDPEKKAQAESRTIPVFKGDILLVCSDGLSGVLRDKKTYDVNGNLLPGENLEDLIRANRSSMCCCREALWNAAERAEWYDNVTAILCEILDGEEERIAAKQETSAQENIVRSKSYIAFRVHKKTLFWCVGIFFLLFLISLIFVNIRQRGHNYEKERYCSVCDSLSDVANCHGVLYIKNKVDSLKAVSDTVLLANMEQELCSRICLKNELDQLRKSCDSTYIGLHNCIDSLNNVVAEKNNIQEVDSQIQKLKKTWERLSELVKDCDQFQKKYNDSRIQKYVELLKQKSSISEEDKRNWEQLKSDIQSPNHSTPASPSKDTLLPGLTEATE